MPRPLDDSDDSTLPNRDLNPLLNPLLAEHMGRWAEVYFTNPPEKREQAIAELLRELGSAPRPETAVQHNSEESSEQGTEQIPEDLAEDVGEAIPEARAGHSLRRGVEELGEEQPTHSEPWRSREAFGSVLICGSCGKSNLEGQRFCGMCGAALRLPPEHSYPSRTDHELPHTGSSWSERGLSPSGISDADEVESEKDSSSVADRYLAGRFPGSQVGGRYPDSSTPQMEHEEPEVEPDEMREFALPQPESVPSYGSVPSFAAAAEVESESVPYRYRAYVGVVLAVILGSLFYMLWRNKQNPSGSAALQSQPSSNAIPQPATGSTTPLATKNATGFTSQTAPGRKRQAAQPQSAKPSPRKLEAADRPGPRGALPSGAANSPASAAGQSGSEELLMAEKYLRAGPGTARDSQEAARWLWKAVGKQNLAAAMMLSDLYLQGDGVPKSCDQARLLLDVAAKKGSAAAADRLRNFPAFGCP